MHTLKELLESIFFGDEIELTVSKNRKECEICIRLMMDFVFPFFSVCKYMSIWLLNKRTTVHLKQNDTESYFV